MNNVPLQKGEAIHDKPERVQIIQQDEIVNLSILLNTSDDVNDFLNKI